MIIRYADAVKLQLIEIWNYSRRTWGDERADRYVRNIDAQVRAVAEGRRRSRPCPHVAPGFGVVRSGSHSIYVKLNGDVLYVAAILHQRMDPRRHIK